MRWLTFAIFAYVFLVLETGLRTLWRVGDVSPNLLLILLVFVGLWSTPWRVIWAGLVLGLLVDLTSPLGLIGPAALGYMVAGYVCLQLRGLLFRDSALSIGGLVFLVGIFVNLVVLALLTLRGVNLPGVPWLAGAPLANWQPADQMLRRFYDLVYTSVLAVPVGLILIKTDRLWGFEALRGMGPYHARR